MGSGFEKVLSVFTVLIVVNQNESSKRSWWFCSPAIMLQLLLLQLQCEYDTRSYSFITSHRRVLMKYTEVQCSTGRPALLA